MQRTEEERRKTAENTKAEMEEKADRRDGSVCRRRLNHEMDIRHGAHRRCAPET